MIDVKTIEGDAIARLFSEVDAGDFKFDSIMGKVVSESNYILSGSEYKANIFLAAVDTKKDPLIYIGDTNTRVGKPLTEFESGTGVYKVGSGGIGEQKFTGWIEVIPPGETSPKYYNFASSYMVGQPSATISADKMNVFYIGVDNPVTISVPGASNEQVVAVASNGSLSKTGNGKYKMVVSAGYNTTKINVSATIGGKSTPMGSTEFRVKPVPTPIPKIAGKSEGVISKNVLAASGVIVPEMENFDFELYFRVTSFKMSYLKGQDIFEKQVSGNVIPPDLKAVIKGLNNGSKVYFEDIQAYGAGSTRKLQSMIFKLVN